MSIRKIVWGKTKSESTTSSNSDLSPSIKSPTSINSDVCITPEPEKSPLEKKIIADKFEGVYTTDYDILNIHYSILHKYDTQLKNISIYNKNLQTLKREYNETAKPITKKALLQDIKLVEAEIISIQNETSKNEYLQNVGDLLLQYTQLNTEKKIISFRGKKNITEEELQQKIYIGQKRLNIIGTYLEIAKKHIVINLIHQSSKKNECSQCKFDYNLFEEEIDFCPNCGLEHKIILKIPVYTESPTTKATDEKNFIKEIQRFQGKQNLKISEDLVIDLDKYFISYNMNPGYVVKTLPLNKDGEREGTTHDMLREALDKTGNSSYYEDINLIANVYWDYPLPDISHLESKILDDYKITQQAFLEIHKNRTSSLNTQYRLYKHLQLVGWNCKPKQFKGIKTDSIAQKYAELWKQMCDRAGLIYYPD